MIALPWLLVIGLGGGVLALVDGVSRVRGHGGVVLAVLQAIVAAAFLVSFLLREIPGGSLALGAATVVVSALQLFARGSRHGAALVMSLVATATTGLWVAVAHHWIAIPGLS